MIPTSRRSVPAAYRIVLVASTTMTCVLSTAGCASYKAAGPTYICGTLMGGGGPGIAVIDAWDEPMESPGNTVPKDATIDVDYGEVVRVSDSCKTGADMTVQPAGAVLDPIARAKDGRPAAFAMASDPGGPSVVTVRVTRGSAYRILRVQSNPAPNVTFSATLTPVGTQPPSG